MLASSVAPEVSLEEFERCLAAEPDLFFIEEARKVVTVSLRMAGETFVERYLMLHPAVQLLDIRQQGRRRRGGGGSTSATVMVMVTLAPSEHKRRTYRQLDVLTLLEPVAATSCRAYFTFRADQSTILFVYTRRPDPSDEQLWENIRTASPQLCRLHCWRNAMSVGPCSRNGRGLPLCQFLRIEEEEGGVVIDRAAADRTDSQQQQRAATLSAGEANAKLAAAAALLPHYVAALESAGMV
jgi:hypothetical protein